MIVKRCPLVTGIYTAIQAVQYISVSLLQCVVLILLGETLPGLPMPGCLLLLSLSFGPGILLQAVPYWAGHGSRLRASNNVGTHLVEYGSRSRSPRFQPVYRV